MCPLRFLPVEYDHGANVPLAGAIYNLVRRMPALMDAAQGRSLLVDDAASKMEQSREPGVFTKLIELVAGFVEFFARAVLSM